MKHSRKVLRPPYHDNVTPELASEAVQKVKQKRIHEQFHRWMESGDVKDLRELIRLKGVEESVIERVK